MRGDGTLRFPSGPLRKKGHGSPLIRRLEYCDRLGGVPKRCVLDLSLLLKAGCLNLRMHRRVPAKNFMQEVLVAIAVEDQFSSITLPIIRRRGRREDECRTHASGLDQEDIPALAGDPIGSHWERLIPNV